MRAYYRGRLSRAHLRVRLGNRGRRGAALQRWPWRRRRSCVSLMFALCLPPPNTPMSHSTHTGAPHAPLSASTPLWPPPTMPTSSPSPHYKPATLLQQTATQRSKPQKYLHSQCRTFPSSTHNYNSSTTGAQTATKTDRLVSAQSVTI